MLRSPQYKENIIDLTGPQGSAFFLIGTMGVWGRQLGLDTTALKAEMTDSDYYNVVAVFEREFGHICTLEMDTYLQEQVEERLLTMKKS